MDYEKGVLIPPVNEQLKFRERVQDLPSQQEESIPMQRSPRIANKYGAEKGI